MRSIGRVWQLGAVTGTVASPPAAARTYSDHGDFTYIYQGFACPKPRKAVLMHGFARASRKMPRHAWRALQENP